MQSYHCRPPSGKVQTMRFLRKHTLSDLQNTLTQNEPLYTRTQSTCTWASRQKRTARCSRTTAGPPPEKSKPSAS
ncbi:hypothetical protein DUNSADRAFT_3048 [Dunaliella salina]|uniref:Encoded protein n=1 Tax=Dunaliella salina TaxID=3046 RepID=A0ABQ7GUM4_DUNSA|nr:hypothetical protein DUNSADRAFT_3048 [Dunaliella salina]|eukprot:KAF5838316.1 hypothetical protein DUNSADRAFT_3048 [Dunaliella salina]